MYLSCNNFSPREYVDCISHIRLLSWLLLGSLTHVAMYSGNINSHTHTSTMLLAQPIPQEVSCHIADHIQVIFSGFPEQSRTSVLHMSSLFHAFILCQVFIYIYMMLDYTYSFAKSDLVTVMFCF